MTHHNRFGYIASVDDILAVLLTSYPHSLLGCHCSKVVLEKDKKQLSNHILLELFYPILTYRGREPVKSSDGKPFLLLVPDNCTKKLKPNFYTVSRIAFSSGQPEQDTTQLRVKGQTFTINPLHFKMEEEGFGFTPTPSPVLESVRNKSKDTIELFEKW